MAIVKLKKSNNIFNKNEFKLFILVPVFNNTNVVTTITKYVEKEYPSLIYRYNILYSGNLDRFPHYKDVVAKFKKKYHGGVPIYRNYCTSEEIQRKSSVYCNVAEDSITSFNTAISACGSRTGAVVELILINIDDTGNQDPI